MPDTMSSPFAHIGTNDTTRALIVFARFPDGTAVPCDAGTWPDSTLVPAWADSLIEDSAPWDTIGSVTHYYDLVSHGNHLLRGTVYDQVVVLDSSIVYYETMHSGPNGETRVLLDPGDLSVLDGRGR